MVESDLNQKYTDKHCIDHLVCKQTIGMVHTWKGEHMAEHKDLDKKFHDQKNWVIGILVAVCLNLVGVVAIFLKT